GHKRIAFISLDGNLYTMRTRQQGYREAMTAAGLTPDVQTATDAIESTASILRKMFVAKRPPTALFCANNLLRDMSCVHYRRSKCIRRSRLPWWASTTSIPRTFCNPASLSFASPASRSAVSPRRCSSRVSAKASPGRRGVLCCRLSWSCADHAARACRSRNTPLLHAVFANDLFIERRTQLRRALLCREVHVDNPEPLRVAIGPLIVVQQTPQKITSNRHAVRNRPTQLA